jgi:uncharacterized protein involved in outer membrane biogenesis
VVVAIGIAVIFAGWISALAVADSGALNTAIERVASARLHRRVAFSSLRLYLLSANSRVEADNLVVGAPPWAGAQPLLTVDHLEIRLRLLALLFGRIEPIDITARGLNLNLVRRSADLQSWSFSKGSSPPLSKIRSLVLDGGNFTLADYGRQTFLKGSFNQKVGRGVSSAFIVNAQGSVKGCEVRVRLNGGPLQRKTTDPYPMSAEIVDGGTVVQLIGQTKAPLDFQHFTFAVQARGPNLADLHYLFSLLAMNSRRYDLRANATRDGSLLDLTGLTGKIGESDISGSSHSDRSEARPKLKLKLFFNVLTLGDMKTFMSPSPAHAAARVQPGSPAPKSAAGRPISSKNFDLARLRASDFNADISVLRITGIQPPIINLRARVLSHGGLIVANPVVFNLKPGLAHLSLTFDVRPPTPKLALQASLVGTHLATLKGRQHAPIDGAADFWLSARGEGLSPAAVAASSSGRAAFRIAAGHLPKVQAGVLGGDAMQALNGVLNKTASSAPLRCVVGEFDGARGEFSAHRLILAVGDGAAEGAGVVDLKGQTYQLQLRPIVRMPSIFKFDLPVRIGGPLNQPKAFIDLAKDDGLAVIKGAVGGVAATALTVLKGKTPPPLRLACEPLLTDAAGYVGTPKS